MQLVEGGAIQMSTQESMCPIAIDPQKWEMMMGQDGEANIQILKLTLTFIVHYKADRAEIIIIIIIIIIIVIIIIII